MMGKFRILWDNKFDLATLAASSAAADLPVTNLQHDWITKHWRSTGLSLETVDADLLAALDIKAFFAFSHNIRQGADLNIQADAHAGYGSLSVNDVIAITADMVAYDIIGKFWAAAQSFRYWRQLISDDASGHPDGYISEARVFLGSYFEFSFRPSVYPNVQDVDPSQVLESLEGQRNINVRTPYQKLKWKWDALPPADIAALRTIFATVGTKPFFVCWDSDDPIKTTLYVHTVSAWEYPPAGGGYSAFELEVETER